MNDLDRLSHSIALWNRTHLDLTSQEIIAQILVRGSSEDWRAMYRLARNDRELRRRILDVVMHVPLPLPRFWLAALAELGETVDFDARLPAYDSGI